MEDLDIFTKTNLVNGSEYLKKVDFEIPIRIKNIIKNEQFLSEKNFYERLESLIYAHTSFYLFPNNLCYFYPKTLEHKASKELTCHLSGAIIKPGEEYYCYRPLLENLETKKVYTITNTVISSLGYQDLFPQTLFEFEDWCQKLNENYYNKNSKIDFYEFSIIAGSNALYLKELNRNTIKRKQRENLKLIKQLEKEKKELIALLKASINPNEVKQKIYKIDNKINQLIHKI